MIDLVFSVSGLVLTLLIVAGCWQAKIASKAVRRALIGVVTAYTLASLYCVPYGFGRLLVAGYRPLGASDLHPGSVAIVLLGVGESVVRDWDGDRLTILGPVGAARILESFRVYRLCTDAWIISSGGAVSTQPGAPTSAGMMQDALIHLGVPPSRILLETQSQTTHDEAVFVGPMLRDLSPAQVVLVTSDVHMRRALGAFRSAGLIPLPAIARDPNLPFGWRKWTLPANRALEFSGGIAHEVVGIGYYAAHGWWR